MAYDRILRADALTTIAAARDYLNLSYAARDQEETLILLVNAVTGRFNGHCSRNLKSRTYAGTTAIIVDGDNAADIVVPHYPITVFTSAKYRDSADGSLKALDIVAAWFDINNIHLVRAVTPRGVGNIAVECEAGYKAGLHDSELDTLEFWSLRMIEVAWIDKLNQIGRGISANMAGGSVTFIASALPKDVEAGLAPFRGM